MQQVVNGEASATSILPAHGQDQRMTVTLDPNQKSQHYSLKKSMMASATQESRMRRTATRAFTQMSGELMDSSGGDVLQNDQLLREHCSATAKLEQLKHKY